MTRRQVIIDTDPGIDDAMAIVYALSDPGIELLGLTTVFGNVPVKTATRNALHILAVAGAEVPVAEGAAYPSAQPPLPHPDFVHGAGGLGGIGVPEPARAPDPRGAARFLAETCADHPGAVTIIAVGPLTNLARAVAEHPEIVNDAARVIVMGAALRTRGNVTEHAEANIWQDPHAAAAVLRAGWRVDVVGLDVTEKVRLTPADLAGLATARPRAGGFLAEAAETYFAFHRRSVGLDGCFVHDPTAVIRLTCPELFDTVEAPVAVDLAGETAGRTREAASGPPATLCLGVDAEAVRRRFLDVIATGPLP